MFSFFFFGTLQDNDIRELVVGRSIPRQYIAKAILRGYRCVRLRSRVQPGIVEDSEGQMQGTLVRHLDVTEAARISHYETDAYDTVLRPVEPLNGGEEKAWIFLSDPNLSVAPGEWKLKNWQQRHKPRSLIVARDWLARLNHAELASSEAEWRKRSLIDSGN